MNEHVAKWLQEQEAERKRIQEETRKNTLRKCGLDYERIYRGVNYNMPNSHWDPERQAFYIADESKPIYVSDADYEAVCRSLEATEAMRPKKTSSAQTSTPAKMNSGQGIFLTFSVLNFLMAFICLVAGLVSGNEFGIIGSLLGLRAIGVAFLWLLNGLLFLGVYFFVKNVTSRLYQLDCAHTA